MGKLLLLQPKLRKLARAMRYVDSPGLFSTEKEKALPLVMELLFKADPETKHRIMMLLASFAREEGVVPLYTILADPSEPLRTRHYAAMQLRTILPQVERGKAVEERLVRDLSALQPDLRRFSSTALGWPGNEAAFLPLSNLLYDSNLAVRLASIQALCNTRDQRVFALLSQRLVACGAAEKRSILMNLWRTGVGPEALAGVYAQYAQHPNPELRVLALALLEPVSLPHHAEILKRALNDPDARIRKLALERLVNQAPERLQEAEDSIRRLLEDQRMDIKRTALHAIRLMETA